ncbi:sigma-E processing peptidase SpoIIGA [Anaerocolumna jejuensis DSM 15929]|uniref:Sigma-E processing peptidase SpoIIGA n=1 Tax=Anaerocolumna jejuensis DSM 15929 TaxID=1121322 RepID=A0A1M6NHU2_9FIRM|nr:sigma-E processing peptidase SpoIIGA [Anaerocolumna jejuensis]SHJ95203.1 sigma-E processing peptidase SpoIIGA [Anaerocolumna jejuensis DSM 15929]
MYLEVYVDVIFIINFIMDFLLLITVKKILRYASSLLRLCLGAVTGAIGACLFAVTPEVNRLVRFLLAYLLLSYLMIIITFGKRFWRERVKALVLLYISTFFLGGLLNSLYSYTSFGFYLMKNQSYLYLLFIFVSALAAMIIFIRFLRKLKRKGSEFYQTELIFNGKTVRAVGFMDTGNCLRDPYFGKPVIVTEYTVIEPLLTNSQNTMLRKLLDDFESGSSPFDGLKGEELRRSIHGKISGNIHESIQGKASGNIQESIPGKDSGNIHESIQGKASGNIHECNPGKISENVQRNIPESVQGNISENFQENVSGSIPGNIQEEFLPIRLIPFHSVGKNGILPAFELDKIILWEEREETVREKVLAAVSREKLSVRKDYQIILHKEVM